MSEMIERVAAAIAKSCGCGSVCTVDPEKCCCRKDAIAAIKAMRVPTDQMIDAALGDTNPIGCCLMDHSDVRKVCQSMIDAALRGEEG